MKMVNLDDSNKRAFRNATPRVGLIRRKVRDESTVLSSDQISNHALSDFFIWGLEGRKDQTNARTIIKQEIKTPYFKIENIFATIRKTVSSLNEIFHPGIQMILLLKPGNSIQYIAETKTILKKDNLYLLCIPAQGCVFRIKPGEYRFLILTLENELVNKLARNYLFFSDILSKHQNSQPSIANCEADMLMIQTIKNLGINMRQKVDVNQFHIEANCMQILSFVIENIVREYRYSPIHHIDEMLQSTIQLIQENYFKENISEELTKLGYTVESIDSAMLQRYGVSLDDYIKMIRLKKGYELLSEGVLVVTEIAEIVGYSDKSKFENDFQEYNQMSAHTLLAKSQKIIHVIFSTAFLFQ